MPQPYPGTAEQRQTNHRTHRWWAEDGEWVCAVCSAKPWHVSAQWPCGVESGGMPSGMDRRLEEVSEGDDGDVRLLGEPA